MLTNIGIQEWPKSLIFRLLNYTILQAAAGKSPFDFVMGVAVPCQRLAVSCFVNGIPYAITAGHPIYQLLDPDDDESTPSQHGQLKASLSGAPKARVEVAAMDFANAGLLNIGNSGDHPSPDPTSDFALLAIDQIRNLKQVNLYQPRLFNGIPISVQKIDEKPTGGKVDIILGKSQIRKAVLEDSTSYFVQDDAILQTQALHLDAPLGKYRLELFSVLLMA